MKKILQLISVYIFVLVSIFSLYYTINKRVQTQLSYTQSELSGTQYLQNIYKLTLSIALYKESLESLNDKSEQIQLKKQMQDKIDSIYLNLKENPKFKSKSLNKKLLRLSQGKFQYDEYYEFLDDINNENYRIGDISRLLFEEDRDIYFLGSLSTHYMPEFLISLLIAHTKVEELTYKGSLTLSQKNLFIEQNKLIYLSSRELEGIIKRLELNPQTHKLYALMSQLHDKLELLKSHTQSFETWKNNPQELGNYLNASYEAIHLAKKLNSLHFDILQSRLNQREEALKHNIIINKATLIFLTLALSVIAYYFYKSHTSNLEKDKEIKKISSALDESVIYSRSDKHGNFTHVSTALCKLSGYSRNELIGKTQHIFSHPDTPATHYKELWKTINNKQKYSGELINKSKDGKDFWVKTIITPDLDEEGNILGFDTYREEISDKKALEEEKHKTQEALEFKSMFLSNMSHEIRTPLNGIIGFTHLALESELNPKQHQLIEKIGSASKHLLGVINDILDLSKIESGQMRIEKIAFNLKENVENVKNLLSFMAKEKGLTFEVEYININDFTVLGDPLRFSQVLSNLVSNALKFTSKGGVIVRVKQLEEARYLCEVVDTGIGLKEAQKSKLFQDFMQADMSTSRQYGGTGLGLSISKKLVEGMGGEISVESQFSVGSTFSFILPLPKASTELSTQNNNEQKNSKQIQKELNTLKGKHILVAEDNKMNQMLLQMLLEQTSLILDFAKDGECAVKKFNENEYALVLMDIQMPKLNGYEAAEKIRSINTKIPIIALSANAMVEDVEKSLAAGMNDHLAKPIEVDKLNALLLKYLKS